MAFVSAMTVGALRFEPVLDALVDATAGLTLKESFTYHASPFQGFRLYHDPELRPGRTIMGLCEQPGWKPDPHPPRNYDPNGKTLFYSARRTLLFEWTLDWWYWRGDLLPMWLRLPPCSDEATALRRAVVSASDAQRAIGALMEETFRTCRPPLTDKTVYRTCMVVGSADARQLFGRMEPTFNWKGLEGVIVAEKLWSG